MTETWWQTTLRERLPPDALIKFGQDGGAVKAQFGPWMIDSGWGCSWTDIRGPGIYDRIAITGSSFHDQWNRVVDVLSALGAPIRPGRSFDPFTAIKADGKPEHPPTSESGVSAGPDGRR